MTTVVLRTTVRTVLPIILVLSVALFIQGHNLPGGGFIAGVLTSAALALVYIAYGVDYLESEVLDVTGGTRLEHIQHQIVTEYRLLFAAGLGIAVGSGLVAVALGYPLFTQAVLFVKHVPLYGEVELASAVVFDLGVYAVVVGSLLTILSVVGAE
ncbi:MAG: MnhB domain-containing protein [Halobacteriaceae archaeon]